MSLRLEPAAMSDAVERELNAQACAARLTAPLPWPAAISRALRRAARIVGSVLHGMNCARRYGAKGNW